MVALDRGQRRFEDVAEGDAFGPLHKQPDYMDLVRYAGAARSFNAIHHDRDVARGAGLPNVIVHGSLKSAYLGELACEWMGPQGVLRRLAIQYRGLDVPGERLAVYGRVRRTYVEDDAGLVDCELWVESPNGARSTIGTALIALPRRRG